MYIYGVALLAGCYLAGKILGNALGAIININGDVGGVGFGIVLLMLSANHFKKKGWLPVKTESGIFFWSAIYIPIIVAMAATQNVKAAVSAGPVAILAGIGATLAGMWLVPVLAKIGKVNPTTKNLQDGDH